MTVSMSNLNELSNVFKSIGKSKTWENRRKLYRNESSSIDFGKKIRAKLRTRLRGRPGRNQAVYVETAAHRISQNLEFPRS